MLVSSHGCQVAVPLIKMIQPRPYQNQQQGYLPNGNSATGPMPGAQPLLPHNGRIIQQGATRVLCIADVRGKSSRWYSCLDNR